MAVVGTHMALYRLLLAVLLGAASRWASGEAVRAAGLLVLPSPWALDVRLAYGIAGSRTCTRQWRAC
jgi:hypothetical protein